MEEEFERPLDLIDQLIQESSTDNNPDIIRVKPIESHICSDMLSTYEIT